MGIPSQVFMRADSPELKKQARGPTLLPLLPPILRNPENTNWDIERTADGTKSTFHRPDFVIAPNSSDSLSHSRCCKSRIQVKLRVKRYSKDQDKKVNNTEQRVHIGIRDKNLL